MRALKIFLIGGLVLMLVAVGFGVYVWYQLQGLDDHAVKEKNVPTLDATIASSTDGRTEEETLTGSGDTPEATNSSSDGPMVREKTTPDAPPEDIVIDERELTPEQIKLLNRLGVDTNTIVITNEMVVCAEAKLGSERVDEIVAGATPTMLEGLSVLPCLN